jgi:hypothetical protein
MATTTPIRSVSKTITPAGANLILLDDGVSMGKASLDDSVAAVADGLIATAIDDLSLGTASQSDATDFATAAQGAKADTAFQPADAPDDDDLSNDGDKLALRKNAQAALDAKDTFPLPVKILVDGATTTPQQIIQNLDYQPAATFADVEVGKGALYIQTTRTGGAGSYGHVLIDYNVDCYKGPGYQDHGLSVWVNSKDVDQSRTNAFWPGANFPASGIAGHNLVEGGNGHLTIAEGNAGNRWADFGMQSAWGGSGSFVAGFAAVPDIIPSKEGQNYWPMSVDTSTDTITVDGSIWQANTGETDGHNFTEWLGGIIYARDGTLPTGLTDGMIVLMRDVNAAAGTFKVASTLGGNAIDLGGSPSGNIAIVPQYPGNFAFAAVRSRGYGQWYVGHLIHTDTIRPGGVGSLMRGAISSTVAARPSSAIQVRDWWGAGINLNLGSFTGNFAIQMASAHKILVGTTSGGAQFGGPASGTGFEVLTLNDASVINLKSTHGTAIAINDSGSAVRMGFFGITPVAQPSGTGEIDGFATGAGTPVHDDSLFTGNLGTRGYRINDIVKALKQVGLLYQGA